MHIIIKVGSSGMCLHVHMYKYLYIKTTEGTRNNWSLKTGGLHTKVFSVVELT